MAKVDLDMNKGMGRKTLNNERGAILITILLLMAIITLIGIIAINTSTLDIQISGQTKRASKTFEAAEAGVEMAVPLVEDTLLNGSLPAVPTGIILDTANLVDELNGGSDYDADTGSNADVKISSLNGVEVNVDIDRLYSYILAGGALEFGAGYEGIGAGAAGGGVAVLYRIDGQGSM